jgi:hypothetical protein
MIDNPTVVAYDTNKCNLPSCDGTLYETGEPCPSDDGGMLKKCNKCGVNYCKVSRRDINI